MAGVGSGLDEASVLQLFDRSTPDSLLRSIAKEFARVNQSHATLQARVSALEALRATTDRIAAGEEGSGESIYPSKVSIDAAGSFLDGVGFYGLEHDDNGVPFRWTGPETHFSFAFFIDRSAPRQFSFVFGWVSADSPVTELRCFADGGEEVVLTLTRNGSGDVATGVLPAKKGRGGSVLTFVCPKMQSPQSRGEADSRLLGVAFRVLTIQPHADFA